MNTMQRFFVASKHWQVFAFLVGLFCVAEAVVVLSETADSKVGIPIPALIAAELGWICFVAWFWSLGSFLRSLVRPDLRLSPRFFRFALILPLVYMAVFQLAFDRLTTSPGYIVAIFPFHLFAMYCLFFNLYFVSKNLALAETGKAVSFYDYAGPFFLLWFFPVGIWFIQPRINRLYAGALH